MNSEQEATDDARDAATSTSHARARRFAMVRWDTIEPTRWSRGFSALNELGFDGVDLPIVWSAHEREDRSRDFTSARRDVAAVVRAARNVGLAVRVRVGPRCVENEPAFGVARWALADPAALARNARRGAVLEPIGLVPTPAPSFASRAFIEASASWVRAVVEHLAKASLAEIEAVVVGPGTFAPLRADALESDHHPEAGPIAADREQRRAQAERVLAAYYQRLFDEALRAGASERQLRASLVGSRTTALAARALADKLALDTSTPFAASGTAAIWDDVRSALASCPRGVHFDVGCGSSPFARPLRNRDAVSAARAVLAAGARSMTVRYAWTGDGWVGSLLDPAGVVQRAGMRWRALFDECAAVPVASAVDAREAVDAEPSWIPPVYGGWLAQYDLLSKREQRDTLALVGLRCDAPQGAFARREGTSLVLLSACEKPVIVRDEARAWIEDGAVEIAPGALVVCARRQGAER